MRNELDFFRRSAFPRAFGRGGLTRFFDDFFEPVVNDLDLDIDFNPAMDLEETDKEYLLKLDIPGMEKDDIKVECIGNQLIVSGERTEEKTEVEKSQRYVERRYGSFKRSVTLPQNVNADKIDANYNKGVLELTVPKTEESRPRKIKVAARSEQAKIPIQ